jgi:hypothetical protein
MRIFWLRRSESISSVDRGALARLRPGDSTVPGRAFVGLPFTTTASAAKLVEGNIFRRISDHSMGAPAADATSRPDYAEG